MDLAIVLNPNSQLPLHRQLYEELRRAILTGRLVPNQRIPSSRSLAKSLGISRTTVTQSYEQLLSEGYLETIVGSGTFVCSQLPDELLHSAPMPSSQRQTHISIQLSDYAIGLTDLRLPGIAEPEMEISFRYGRPAFHHFPIALWRKLLARHARRLDWLDYAIDPLGYEPLRVAIARYLARARAVQCTPDQILLTNGTQQALYLIMRLLLNPGETIALEEPGYLSARRIFRTQGARLMPIPVDEAGLIVSKLIDAIESIKLVYVTPSHQFPTGAILSLSRRLELLAWAHQQGALILEDDYDSEYRYGVNASFKENRPIPALQGLDQQGSVLYMGTFSKVLSPGLRIGYLVLPPDLVAVFARAKWLSDRQLPLLEQYVLTDIIEAGHLERHIRQMRLHYDQCRRTLVQALKTHFGTQVSILGETAGIHLMVRFDTSLTDEQIIDRAAQVGVGMMSAQPQYLNPIAQGEFIFGYAELTPAQIEAGIGRLAQVLLPR